MVDDRRHNILGDDKGDDLDQSQRIFVASSVTQAMQIVRREMGDQAVIVQVRRRPGESGLVEVIASENADTGQVAEYIAAHDPLPALLKQLGLWIERFFSESLQTRLLQEVEKLAKKYPKGDARDVLVSLLERELQIFDVAYEQDPETPVMLVGPAGMGKTSVAMKIAVSHRLENLPARLINLDGKRLGSRHTLSNFAKLADIRLHHLQEDGAARKLSENTTEYTLIDTSPMNPFSTEQRNQFLTGFDHSPMKRLLVLSVWADEALMLLAVDTMLQYATIDGLVFTCLDVVPDYRKIINFSLQCGIPIAAINQSAVLSSALPSLDADYFVEALFENEKELSIK